LKTENGLRLKYLVLGGGAVVAEFYLPAFAGLGWLDDVYVADPSKIALDRLTAQYPELKVLPVDFHSALNGARELGVQAVIIALPNVLHEAAVAAALDCGLDVLCEKPLALTQAACERLGDHAVRAGRLLAVGMTRRFLPSTGALRRVLDAGWLGAITSIELEDGHNFAWSSESGAYGRPDNAGVLANIGVHALDLVEYLCGPLTPAAYDDDWGGGVEVNATFDLRTADGAPVRLKLSYTHDLANSLRIRGTRGELIQSREGVSFVDDDGGLRANVSVSRPFQYGTWPDTFESAIREEFSDFKDAILSRRPPCATAEHAARTAALIDWAYSHHAPQRLTSFVSAESERPQLDAGRIVVTGGTGFVGGHLIETLARQGHRDLIVPIRTFQRSANSWRFPVQLQRADLLDPPSLRNVMTGSRYVFHLAFGRDGANAARVTVEGTRNVIDAAIDAGAECVVVLSTTAVFGDPGGPREVDESFPYGPPNREYEKTKAEAERQTLARARGEKRTRIVVLNPACVYGPGSSAFTELPARLLRDGGFCWVEDGRGIANYVYVTNLVDAMLLAANSREAHGERFIISDGYVSWRRFFSELFGKLAADIPSYTQAQLIAMDREGRPTLRDVARTVVQNDELWRMVGANPGLAATRAIVERATPGIYRRVKNSRRRSPGHEARASVSGPVGKPPVFLDTLFGETTTRLSAEKARRVLGWTSRIDLAAGQSASRQWLTELGLLPSQPASAGRTHG
jgi:nucleoside-diphosphate-sugar epimerase/predicted dehydrogenase